MNKKLLVTLLIGSALVTSTLFGAQNQMADSSATLDNVGLDQKLGSQIPLNLEFANAAGEQVSLGSYFGEKPVLLTLVYYECPMLCTLILNGTLRALRTLEFTAGNEFEVVTVSISPTETPALAQEKKVAYLEKYQRSEAADGWHFLTGKEAEIKALADSVGFRYSYDPESGQYAHASGIMILTPEGKVARYFYGVEYSPRDIRLGLIEATQNEIGSPVDQVLLFCYQYNPLTGKYSFAIMSLLRVAGALTLIGIAVLIVYLLKRDRSGTQVEARV